jgi:hypothetical protein
MGFTYIRFSKAMLVSATHFISKEVKHHRVEHLLILVPTKKSVKKLTFWQHPIPRRLTGDPS